MPTRHIPFFSNTADGTHCFQAALRIVLKHFWSNREFLYEELDKITAKIPGKWTWPTAAMIWLMEQGFELRLVEDFDYQAFADRGEQYILERCGPEVGEAQIKNSIISREQEYAAKFTKIAPLECRIPTFSDLNKYLNDGYLIICNINASSLYNQPGYSGHFVVVFKCGWRTLTIHDPGLPPKPALTVKKKDFEKAWAYPTEREKNLLAIRLRQNQK